MTSPTAMIDADLGEWDKISYFVLEISAIWRTQNLADAGAATWTKIFDLTTDFTLEGTEPGFTRIRCAPGTPYPIVYVLGYATEDLSGDIKPFVMRSANNGLTWHQGWVDEALPVRAYKPTYKVGPFVTEPAVQEIQHTRWGDADATYNPLAMAFRFHYDNSPWAGWQANATNILNIGDSAITHPEVLNTLVNTSAVAAGTAALTDYFGAAALTGYSAPSVGSMPKDAARTYIRNNCYHAAVTYDEETWVFWNYPSVMLPRGFDVARSNHDVLFLGLSHKILTSIDGGYNWTVCTADFGAYDIKIDPQLAGVIYCWSTEGELRCIVANLPQLPALLTGDTLGEFDFLRLERDFNTGKLWAIDSLGNLKEYNLGGWTTLLSGLTVGRGLKAFYASPTKLALLDDYNIHLSLDAGATWALKKGGWSTYAKPNTIHLLGEPV